MLYLVKKYYENQYSGAEYEYACGVFEDKDNAVMSVIKEFDGRDYDSDILGNTMVYSCVLNEYPYDDGSYIEYEILGFSIVPIETNVIYKKEP